MGIKEHRMVSNNQQNAIRAKLCLLARRTKLHEWTSFNNEDEKSFEEEEAKIDDGNFEPPNNSCET